MERSIEFVITPTVAALRDFVSRPGARHAFVLGQGGSGKTAALQYLASHLRAEDHLVVIVFLREIASGDQLVQEIARGVLDQTRIQSVPEGLDPLEKIRLQLRDQFTTSQRFFHQAAGILDVIINTAIQRAGLKPRAYIFLDGLDETYRAGDLTVALENLAERLTSASIVVTSRSAALVDRLGARTAFDTFTMGALTNADAKEFLGRLLPDQAFPDPVLERLISAANGSPLLLSQLAKYVGENPDLGTIEKTETMRSFLGRYYQHRFGSDQASRDARLLLTLLAFLQPVSPAYLAEISGLAPNRARVAIELISDSSIVSSSDRQITFAHALFVEYHIETNVITEAIDLSTLQFGDEAAERDTLLKQNFMTPRDLHFIVSGAKTIVLGDRGAGKSAVFRALQELNHGAAATDVAREYPIVSASQDPASFVQQMTPEDSATSSADGFKAVWLLYSAALTARDVDVPADTSSQHLKAFIKDSRRILRYIGWADAIEGESRFSRWAAAARNLLPEKISLKMGPITVEPNLTKRRRGWLGSDIKIDDYLNRADRLLQASNRRLLIVFDQIDEAFKYRRDRQEALVQGLFLAEAFLSLRHAIRLVVLLRTDLFQLYDIQEKNKFVSRTVRLDWDREEIRRQMLQRLFSNDPLQKTIESLNATVESGVLARIEFQIVFPSSVEGKAFEDWLFEHLKNGKEHVAPRQIILFLNLAKEIAKGDASRHRIPLFREREVADAMTRLSELSYQEVISDFRAATAFVRNCRAGKIMEFRLEDVKTLFDDNEGPAVLQLERLERLGFIGRIVVKEGESLVQRFRIPRLFTRCWETSN